MIFISILLPIIFLFIGIGILIFGLYSLKWKRLIENIPTSKIRSIAMGLVEIVGRVIPLKGQILRSPFSQKDCVYYRYQIDELRSSGKNSRWVTIKKGEEIRYFYLEDETGRVLVNPANAKIRIKKDNTFNSQVGKNPPTTALPFLIANNVSYKGILFGMNRTMRYYEWFIEPNDRLYILGTAADNPFVKEGSAELSSQDIMISKGKNEKVYYISDKSEKELLFTTNLKIYISFLLGPVFIISSVIIYNLGG